MERLGSFTQRYPGESRVIVWGLFYGLFCLALVRSGGSPSAVAVWFAAGFAIWLIWCVIRARALRTNIAPLGAYIGFATFLLVSLTSNERPLAQAGIGFLGVLLGSMLLIDKVSGLGLFGHPEPKERSSTGQN
jgi:hypothetical protein